MSEKTKKVLKIIVIVFLALLLLGLFKWFFGKKSVVGPGGIYGPHYEDYEYADDGYLGIEPDFAPKDALPSSGLMSPRQMSEPAVFEETSSVVEVTDKKVIKSGNLTLKVENADESATTIATVAKNNNGEVFSTNFRERTDGTRSGTIVIKIPVDKFETVMEEVKKVATQVVMESSSGQDVTEQYVDLQAQLKNKKAEEQAYVKLLDQAGEMEDVLSVTKQLSRVRGEIERLEAQKRYLESQTDMSTITVFVSEDVEISTGNEWRPWEVVKTSVKALIKQMQNFIDNSIRFIVVTIPSLIVFALFIWLLWWIGKKVYLKLFKKSSNKEESSSNENNQIN